MALAARKARETDRWAQLLSDLDARIQSLDNVRWSWWYHWRELADYILPRRMRWLYPYNQTWNRGSEVNQRIINNTATIAARTLASGLLSGTTSPSKPWFQLTVSDQNLADIHENKVWLAEATNRMMRVMAGSNYYSNKGVQYFDEVVFGTSPMIIYSHPEKLIHCYVPTPGEYFLATNGDYEVDCLYRRFPQTVQQIVSAYGIDNVTSDVRQMYETGGAGLAQEVICCHAIEPNPNHVPDNPRFDEHGLPKLFRFREIYWIQGRNSEKPLKVAGFEDKPFSALRWDVFGNDAYGRSPGMDALGDTKQLQFEETRKAQAIDKMVRPPMMADASMKNEPASLLPGAITYVPQLSAGVGFRPVFQVIPPLAELLKDMQAVENRIKDTFFNGLFQMISQLDTVRTATEIDARQQEKLLLLGPVLERNDTEGLGPDIKRIFAILARAGVFPEMPETMQGASIKIEYVSMLSDIQRGSRTASIERTMQVAGNLVGVIPNIMDNIDADVAIREYGSLLRVDPRMFRSMDGTAQIRQARSQQEQQAAALQTGAVAAEGAKTLSETDTGGGISALQALLGNA